MRRLYPVPFRLIEEGQQFKKWQWIEVTLEKAKRDHRIESHKLYVDTIRCGEVIDTRKEWEYRWPWLDKAPFFSDFDEVEKSRVEFGTTLALLKPKKILALEIAEARNPDWTKEEREKLLKDAMQGQLFNATEIKKIEHTLRKVPFDFRYRYLCDTDEGEKIYSHKIVDWEAGALFWNCKKSDGKNWQQPFRAMLEKRLITRDLMFLMGNQHRFPDQWLIVSLLYPPMRKQAVPSPQGLLF